MGQLAGFVAVRVGPDKISSIATNNASWQELGDTGETLCRRRRRPDAVRCTWFHRGRGVAYLEAVEVIGTATDRQIRSMETFGTTVMFQPVDADDVDTALDDEPGLVEATNYLGTEVVSSRRALDIDGLDWAMFAEGRPSGDREADRRLRSQPAGRDRGVDRDDHLPRSEVVGAAPRAAPHHLEPSASGCADGIEQDASSLALPDRSPTEFVELALDIDTMLETLKAPHAPTPTSGPRSAVICCEGSSRRRSPSGPRPGIVT